EKVSPGILTTRTSLYLARSGYYRGCTLADSKGGFMGRVDDIENGQVKLLSENGRKAAVQPFRKGQIVYLQDMGPGDRMEIASFAWSRRNGDKWESGRN
ncbi:MAG: hypothetical protein IT210_25510, partial [Armatimonadetes bacterium]|nr:hypothetical protein [Armatimonadota bacterium]